MEGGSSLEEEGLRWSSTLAGKGDSSMGLKTYSKGSGSVVEGWDSSNRNSRGLKTYSHLLQMRPTSG